MFLEEEEEGPGGKSHLLVSFHFAGGPWSLARGLEELYPEISDEKRESIHISYSNKHS